MPASQTGWTVAMVNDLPDDGRRYEVLDGELLVSPAPAYVHQRAILELVLRLSPYVDGIGLHLLFAPAAVAWSPRTELQPDVLVLPAVNGRPPGRFEDVGRLELAVEVLSPLTAQADRYIKRREYQRRGVPECWIVDSATPLVERWRPGDEEPEVLLTSLMWQPQPDHPALIIDLEAYFAAVNR